MFMYERLYSVAYPGILFREGVQ